MLIGRQPEAQSPITLEEKKERFLILHLLVGKRVKEDEEVQENQPTKMQDS